jgi:hypothetical protein
MIQNKQHNVSSNKIMNEDNSTRMQLQWVRIDLGT